MCFVHRFCQQDCFYCYYLFKTSDIFFPDVALNRCIEPTGRPSLGRNLWRKQVGGWENIGTRWVSVPPEGGVVAPPLVCGPLRFDGAHSLLGEIITRLQFWDLTFTDRKSGETKRERKRGRFDSAQPKSEPAAASSALSSQQASAVLSLKKFFWIRGCCSRMRVACFDCSNSPPPLPPPPPLLADLRGISASRVTSDPASDTHSAPPPARPRKLPNVPFLWATGLKFLIGLSRPSTWLPWFCHRIGCKKKKKKRHIFSLCPERRWRHFPRGFLSERRTYSGCVWQLPGRLSSHPPLVWKCASDKWIVNDLDKIFTRSSRLRVNVRHG